MTYLCFVLLNMSIKIIWGLFSSNWESISFKPKIKKCEFDKPRVKYLGYVVGSGEVYVNKDKVAAVANWEAPKDIKGI